MNELQRQVMARKLTADLSHALEDLGLYWQEAQFRQSDDGLLLEWEGKPHHIRRIPGTETWELQYQER